MEKSVETQASSVDIAVEKALVELGVSRDKVDVEVLAKGGLFSKAKVRVTVKDTIADKMAEFINGTLERMGLTSRATVEEKDNTLYITIQGDDSGVAIGYRGEALDAFQYLALTFLNEHKCDFKKVVVDCENYREKRKETLTALAEKLAQKSVRLCRKIALEPMNPFERRIIHSALADSEIADTESEGEEPQRYIVIIPKGVELKDQRPIKNGEREPRKDSLAKAEEATEETVIPTARADATTEGTTVANANRVKKRSKSKTEEYIADISPSKTISSSP